MINAMYARKFAECVNAERKNPTLSVKSWCLASRVKLNEQLYCKRGQYI